MSFISIPNLPLKPVNLAVIDGRVDIKIEQKLIDLGINLIKTKYCKQVYPAISYHPDIVINHIGERDIVYAPRTHQDILNNLASYGFRLIQGSTPLSNKYPGDIAYNVARVGNIAFHNFKYTDPVLATELKRHGVEMVNVNQGYSKCSVSIVNETSIITCDPGIAKAAQVKNIEVLLIDPEKNILLPGLSNGFIGGSTGLIDNNVWAITGSIEHLKAAPKIKDFLDKKGIKIFSLSKDKPIDLGSIIPLMTK